MQSPEALLSCLHCFSEQIACLNCVVACPVASCCLGRCAYKTNAKQCGDSPKCTRTEE